MKNALTLGITASVVYVFYSLFQKDITAFEAGGVVTFVFMLAKKEYLKKAKKDNVIEEENEQLGLREEANEKYEAEIEANEKRKEEVFKQYKDAMLANYQRLSIDQRNLVIYDIANDCKVYDADNEEGINLCIECMWDILTFGTGNIGSNSYKNIPTFLYKNLPRFYINRDGEKSDILRERKPDFLNTLQFIQLNHKEELRQEITKAQKRWEERKKLQKELDTAEARNMGISYEAFIYKKEQERQKSQIEKENARQEEIRLDAKAQEIKNLEWRNQRELKRENEKLREEELRHQRKLEKETKANLQDKNASQAWLLVTGKCSKCFKPISKLSTKCPYCTSEIS